MEQSTFERAKDLQDKIGKLKAVLSDWDENCKGKALQMCGKDIYDAVNKLFNEKVNEKINQLQRQFKEL